MKRTLRDDSDGRKAPRLRLACQRCQRRKIKCDGQLPTCKHCQTAGVACIDGESARLKDLPRAYITNLRTRTQWLEEIIRERCPDVDLSQAPEPGSPLDAEPRAEQAGDATPQADERASHEIGLVSLGASDPRYIGPSSGYFLARVMLTKRQTPHRDSVPTDLIETVQSPAPLPSRDVAGRMADAYFDALHAQYPILHRQTLFKMLDQMYVAETDAAPSFQVFMVLALGSVCLSTRLPAEAYCLSALQYFDRINVENSLPGLQCLLLLLLFALHSPHVRVNIWYLSYQAIAAVVDLGLQRDITTQAGITLLEQEMRTRIFWVVLMLDRVIATTMGRPIGLRDEACDLRLPRDMEDSELCGLARNTALMPFSIHLFRLAKLNSEIKYVANSVVRQTPVYAYPAVVDIYEWQSGMLAQLDDWERAIPEGPARLQAMCRVQRHTLRMVLLRPSPAIPRPTHLALEQCHDSAQATLRLLDELYKSRGLVHSWLTFYAIVLATLTMLYCLKMVPSVRERSDVTQVMEHMAISSSLLSATGEHWSGARRCREILDELGRSVKESLPERVVDPPMPMMEPSVFFDDFLSGGLFDENLDDIVKNMFPELGQL